MNRDEDEFEWDRNRLLALLIIAMTILGIGWTAVRFYTPPVVVENVTYIIETDYDTERYDSLYTTFFGGSTEFENVTLVVLHLMVEQTR